MLASWWYTHNSTFFCWQGCKGGSWDVARAHFWPKILLLFTLHPYNHLHLGSGGSTQQEHISHISWGNSGYLRFSSRWPFGCSAACFSVPIAQSDLFKAKMRKWPKIVLFLTFIKEKTGFGENNVQSLIASFFVHFQKLIRPHPGPLWGGGSDGIHKTYFFSSKA